MKTCHICGHTGNYKQGGEFGGIANDDIIECLSCERYVCLSIKKHCTIYDTGYFCVKCVNKCTSCNDLFHVDNLDTCKKCGEL